MDGLLVVDKPPGCTSHDVVLRVRKIFGMTRVGHGGTLDPEATGVLLVALGQATRFFPFLSAEDKTYTGVIRLGFSTDTYDASGRPTSAETTAGWPSADEVAAAMKSQEGRLLQAPPPYSAKKLGGQPAYKLARARQAVSLEPVRVTVTAFTLSGYAPPYADFEVRCSSGTYVRSLAHDLGERLGCGAHLHRLRRTSSGNYGIGSATPLAEIERVAAEFRAGDFVIPLESLLPEAPAVVLDAGGEARVRNGSPLLPEHLGGSAPADIWAGPAPVVRVFSASGKLLALARLSPDRGALRPFIVIK